MKTSFDEEIVDVQDFWNSMEQKLVEVADLVAPIMEFTGDQASNTIKISFHMKRKMNFRKRLVAELKRTKDLDKKKNTDSVA